MKGIKLKPVLDRREGVLTVFHAWCEENSEEISKLKNMQKEAIIERLLYSEFGGTLLHGIYKKAEILLEQQKQLNTAFLQLKEQNLKYKNPLEKGRKKGQEARMAKAAETLIHLAKPPAMLGRL